MIKISKYKNIRQIGLLVSTIIIVVILISSSFTFLGVVKGETANSGISYSIPADFATVSSSPMLTSANPGNAKVVLVWTAPSSNGGSAITGYKVYRGTTSGGETLLTWPGNVLTYTDAPLTNGKTYYYKVSAVNTVGAGALSNELSATPTASVTTPSAPTLISATPGNGKVVLVWTAPSNNGGSPITGYKVYIGTTSGG
jgi:hypothetical protein